MTPGYFIVLEGVDGAGTTTQSARLTAELARRGHRVHQTCEPSRGPIGLELRRVLKGQATLPPTAVALLFASDRLDHLAREIEPQLSSGCHVVSDRYVLSSLAYQSQQVDRAFVETINARARAADLTLLVAVDPEVAAKRRQRRGGEVELYDAIEMQRQVASAYLHEAALYKSGNIETVDGNGDQDTVFEAILRAVEICLPALSSSSSRP